MLKTLGLIIAIIAAVALAIVVCLVGFALLCVALLALWNWVRRVLPARYNAAGSVSQNILRTTASLHRFRQAHTDAVTALAVLPDEPWMVSTSRDKTLRVRDGKWNKEAFYNLPIYPGPLAVGDHENNGLRVALGIFEQGSQEKDAPVVLVWEPMAADSPGMEQPVAVADGKPETLCAERERFIPCVPNRIRRPKQCRRVRRGRLGY